MNSSPRRSPLWVDLTLLGIVGVLLVAAAAAAVGSLYREFYSPSAFVERYLTLLSEGRAAEALIIDGVAVASNELEAAGLTPTASDALLRPDAMATLTDITAISETDNGGVYAITVGYKAGAYDGTTTFEVERSGTVGVVPTWRFLKSPLAVMELVVKGAHRFDVNGFVIDKRQVSPDGNEADPLAPLALLVFSPGIYSVSVDTSIAATPGVAVLSDTPFTSVEVAVQAEPTPEFAALVQQRVAEFLTGCATQEVLQPTGCPFGYFVQDRIVSPPVWSIAEQPTITLEPSGNGWKIPATEARAHIDVEIRSIFDGSVTQVSDDVPFIVTSEITLLPDGTASIAVSGPDTR